MQNQTDRKVLLSLKDVEVKFNVRGRILTAIRRVSLDIYENEALAIVGESGSGKSVLTKTFAGMLESNGFISNGTIILSDDEISETNVVLTPRNKATLNRFLNMLNKHSVLERGAAEFRAIQEKKNEIQAAQALSLDEEADYAARLKRLKDNAVDKNNYLQTLDRRNPEDAKEMVKVKQQIAEFEAEYAQLEAERKQIIAERMAKYKSESGHAARDAEALKKLEAERAEKIAKVDNPNNPNGLSDEVIARNEKLAKELLLSTARYPWKKQLKFRRKLDKAFKIAMATGEDLNDPDVLGKIFEVAAFRVEYRSFDEETNTLHGYAIIDCAKVKYTEDWQKIRGTRIATVFQDPMTSLNPVITIGKQIMSVILKHQKCSREEARARTIEIMGKVGIPDPEKRFDDYPFEYSGGMRQRIVIAIALSCQPKILICDEPTTALDVTIQAQILQLIKDLQRDLGFTVVYITHDLGVVANVAERVAVLYAGQIVEIGSVEEIFYEPKHPYTWALLSSLPQLCEKGTDLFSIPGTPPSLYNKIKGDAFAPRNQYAMAIDLEKEPPMFQVSPTHFAKTWLLDPRAPKVEIPKNITNLHEKMRRLHVDYEF
ncbi:MAG: ATP-binding cassette domain-containing protein [Oscillospiraceae bacterium]|nr:ATP-binding cassette domain-containing protein [Oscillospiraceae bacterium]